MPTITDVLETVLKLTGAAQYLGGFAAVTFAVKTFAAEEDKLFRTERLFNRLGLATSFQATTKAANELSRATGYSRVEIEQAAGQLAQVGIQARNIPDALKSIADAAAGNAKGLGFAQTTDAFIKGILGHQRALGEYGTTIQQTGSRLGNLLRIEDQFRIRFFGDAARRSQTTAGALDRLGEAFRQFNAAIGSLPQAVTVINHLATALNYLTDHLQDFISLFAILNPVFGPLLRPKENPFGKAGQNPQLATERTAEQIADNTKLTADAIEQAVLGGPGLRAKQAFTFRDARVALSI